MISQLAKENIEEISELVESLIQTYPPEGRPQRPLMTSLKKRLRMEMQRSMLLNQKRMKYRDLFHWA
jgi:hypothetical protein